MDPDLPERLLPARDLLSRSLVLHPRELAPAMPSGLAADLAAHFAPATAASAPAGISLRERFRNWLASPGFGLAATAAVVIGVAIPMISAPSPELFRGDNSLSATTDTVRIAFIGEDANVQAELKSSGNFEAFAFDADAASLPGPKVVINFRTGTISAIDSSGDTVHASRLPAEAKQAPDAVADAISRVSGK